MLGGIAFFVGSVLGVIFQQILRSVIDSMVRIPYSLRLSWDYRTWLMTFGCYAGCYLLAFFRCGFSFRKMNINELMKQDRKNEEIVEKHEEWKRIILPLAVIILILFSMIFTHLTSRPGSDDLSVLYRSVCLDHLLCEKAWKGDLSWTAIIFAAPVCIKDQDNAVYSWNFDIIVYSGTFGGECGIYVLRF